MKKETKVREPIFLKHDTNSPAEMLGMTEEELIEKVLDSNPDSDELFVLAMHKMLFSNDIFTEEQQLVLVAMLKGIFGKNISKRSEVIQLLANSITSKDERMELLTAIANIGFSKMVERMENAGSKS